MLVTPAWPIEPFRVTRKGTVTHIQLAQSDLVRTLAAADLLITYSAILSDESMATSAITPNAAQILE
jgi:hypothetical protein